jgi:hypothetical protein
MGILTATGKGATSLVDLILKKFGNDADGATQELVRMGGFPESVANRIATGELPMDAESVAKRKSDWGGDLEYHGTRANGLLEVDPDKVDLGLHTGPVEQANNRLSQTREWADDVRGETIIPLMVRRGNEMTDMRDIGTWSDSRSVAKEMDNVGYDSYERLEGLELDERFYDGGDWLKSPENRAGLDEFRGTLLDDGFDSIRYKNMVENDYGVNAGLNRQAQKEVDDLGARVQGLLDEGKSRRPPNPMPDVDGMSPDEAEAAINTWLQSDSKLGTDYYGEGFRYLSDAEKAEVKALRLESAKVGNDPNSFADTRSTITLRPENLRSPNAAYDPQYTGPNIMGGAAGTAGLAGLLSAGQSEDADAGFVTRGGKTLLEAFHGSPHKFDKFSMDQIGTGEGAQAYGHGLYFADSEDVAREYRDRLSVGIDGNDSLTYKIGDSEYVRGDPEWKAIATIQNDGIEKAEELRQIYKNDLAAGEPYINADTVKRYSDALDRVNSGEEWSESAGALYRTEIDVTPESLLDWDKPLSEQPQAVQDMANDYGLAGSFTPDGWLAKDWSDTRGSDVYKATYRQLRKDGLGHKEAQKAVSDAMREYDIKGLTYLDGNSRAVGDGTSNYVIFDDSLINIAERGNADPRLLAGVAGTTAAGLAAPMIKDSGFISAPRSEGLMDLTMAARGLERRLEGSPASLLFPEGLVNYLETVNRRTEDPNAMTRIMGLVDLIP